MNDDRIRELIDNIRRDSGGAFACGLAYIGDRLGLFRAVAESGPTSSADLAGRLGLQARYVLEWLKAMAAFGYVEHAPGTDTWWLSEEQAAVLVHEDSPYFGAGSFQFTLPSLLHTEDILAAFRNGGGVAYGDLHPEIPESIDRMHRPWFDHLLTGQWLPSVPELVERLRTGLRVLDVGCGLGRSTAALARAYPASSVVGLDPHAPSLLSARRLVAEHGLGNASFVEATLAELPPEPAFDLVLAIDCIHDMRDPVQALRCIRGLLRPQGLFVWSEPTGSSNPLENRDALPRLRQALSIYHCLTVSLAENGRGLGTLIGEDGARALAAEAGFAHFEVLPVASETQAFYGLR